MMKRVLFFLFSTLVFMPHVHAHTTTVKNSLTGPAAPNNSGIGNARNFYVSDPQYNYMVANPSTYSSVMTNCGVVNRVSLQYKETARQYYSANWSMSVPVEIKKWSATGVAITPNETATLTITYDPAAGTVYTDESYYVLSNPGYRVQVTVTAAPTLTGITAVPGDVQLEGEVETTRSFTFNQNSAPPTYAHQLDNTNKRLRISWGFQYGAEAYDVEWMHASSFDQGGPAADFSRATRVTVTTNNYIINLPYDDGSIYYRIRGVAYPCNQAGFRQEGSWTATGGPVVVSDLDGDRNWQYSAAYAEEGKRKEVLTFFDGTGKQRQAVTLNNTDGVALIGETIYDYEGRPAIQTLPAPTASYSGKLVYVPSLSVAGSSVYDRSVFDKDVYYMDAATCSYTSPPGMSSTEGSSRYYSPQNTKVNEGMYQGLPDAQDYPFTQTVYGADGRPVRQSAPGVDHTIGSNHAVETFYATPSQQRLDRLFGNEVGYAGHYTQTVVKDANGQYSVSVMNLSGKTIYTAMAGEAPQSLDALASNGAAVSLTEDFDNSNFSANVNGLPGYLINAWYLVTTPGTYSFTYEMTPQQYQGLCNSQTYNCVYDLDLNIYDGCNQALASSPASALSTTQTITAPGSYSVTFTVVFTKIGLYRVEKSLTISQAALQTALADYIADLPGSCFDNQGTINNDLNSLVDLTECDGCSAACVLAGQQAGLSGAALTAFVDSCQLHDCVDTTINMQNSCSALLSVFAGDMRPGGQYFDNVTAAQNIPNNTAANNTWLQTNVWADASSNFGNLGFCSGCTTWAQVRSNWQSGWELQTFSSPVTIGSITYNRLVEFHPEYCHYSWCVSTQNSQQFDADVNQDNTIAWATSNPTAAPYLVIATAPTGVSMQAQDPYFTTTPGSGDNVAMLAQLNNYLGSGQTMWAFAGTQAACTNCDQQWQLFRALYQGQKSQLMQARKVAQGCGYLCDSNLPPDAIADNCSSAATQGFYIRVPDVIAAATTANTTTYGNNAQSLITCNTAASTIWIDLDYDVMNGANFGSALTNCVTVEVNGNDITCGAPCLNGIYTPAQVTALVVAAINNCGRQPWDFMAIVDPNDPTRFQLIAPSSIGAGGNSLSVTISYPGYTSSIVDSKFSGGVTGSDLSCLTAKHCFCNEIDLLTTFYNTTSTSSPYAGGYVVDHNVYTTAEAYIQYALNQAHGTSVTLSDVQAWVSSCANSAGADPALTVALNTTLDCSLNTTDCADDAYDITGYYAGVYYQQLIQQASNAFILGYTQSCLSNLNEHYEVTHDDREYHYTLYYYDQAGNLTRTVPPAGVHVLNTTQTAQVNTFRTQGTGSSVYPDHSRATNNLVTNYNYNSLNQLKTQTTPDGGQSSFWYDKVGRIVSSQNARQAAITATNVYSYTLYDGQNRPYQAGELRQTTAMTQTIANDYTGGFTPWVSSASSRTEVINTYYDSPLSSGIAALFTGSQSYLRQRVATVTHEYTDDGNALTWNHATHYSYDVHGNVNELIQDYPQLDHLGGNAYSQRYKKMRYAYDLISGKVNEVIYQKGEGDQYIHRYSYDADNRIIAVRSSANGITWATEAKYAYYLHGPLGRTELGDVKVQGTDYAYTIQGWIKGVNSNVLEPGKDLGKDATAVNNTAYLSSRPGIHSNIAADAYGYTLDYFWNSTTGAFDYKPINTAAQTLYNDAPDITDGVDDLYNGNIKGMAVALMKPRTGSLPDAMSLQYNQYKYDQLNRITQHQAYTGSSTSLYAALSNSNEYLNTFTYDPNGNIITQLRNGNATAGLSMDDLTYNYLNTSGGTYTITAGGPSPLNATNKLAYVDDAGTPGNYSDDLEDQGSGNYSYDAIGQLTSDTKEEIQTIDWTLNNKIKSITRTSTSTKKDLNFEYDAMGNRVLKITKERNGSGIKTQEFWTYTYYVRDAQGNVMATYERKFTTSGGTSVKDELKLDESDIYGSSRLGVEKRAADNVLASVTYAWGGTYNSTTKELTLGSQTATTSMAAQNTATPLRKLGKKVYELVNHLGNVLVTVADRKLAVPVVSTTIVDYYMPDVVSVTDYSPFGAPLPGRQGPGPASYRYTFNGKEADPETGTQDYGFRIYNPSLGKFLSIDPDWSKYSSNSPYSFASCSPVNSIDFDGRGPIVTISNYKYVIDKKNKTITVTASLDIKVNLYIINNSSHNIDFANSLKSSLITGAGSTFKNRSGTANITELGGPVYSYAPYNKEFIKENIKDWEGWTINVTAKVNSFALDVKEVSNIAQIPDKADGTVIAGVVDRVNPNDSQGGEAQGYTRPGSKGATSGEYGFTLAAYPNPQDFPLKSDQTKKLGLTIIHELGHVLGLNEGYETDSNGKVTYAGTGAMAASENQSYYISPKETGVLGCRAVANRWANYYPQNTGQQKAFSTFLKSNSTKK